MENLIQIEVGGPKKRIIGIDLGTTNSLVAFINNGIPEVIKDEKGKVLLPSVITVYDDEHIVVGEEAKHLLLKETSKTVYSVKRLMGKSYQDVGEEINYLTYSLLPKEEGLVRIQINGKEYTPIELSSMILKSLKKRAEEYFNEEIKHAVITVPAYFNDSQRQATRDAGKLAGLDVLRIVNEPTAAALAYGLDKKQEGIIAIYDFGGGTFDISVLKVKNGIFEVLSTNGNTHLGGDDIDRRIVQFMLREAEEIYPGVQPSPSDMQILRDFAEKIKCGLSFTDKYIVDIELPDCGIMYSRNFLIEDLEEIAKEIIDQTIIPCEQAIKDANVKHEEIDVVVLVGGSTRMPLVKRTVEGVFKKKPFDDINPDEVVALGAAIQADILAGQRKDLLLLDVTPLSLGIETFGGVMSVIIPRNTTVPTKVTETFTTFVDNQTGVDIHVLQGERELANDNRSLAKFTLKGIPLMKAGLPKIEVSFMVNADGILNVSAKEIRTGVEQKIEVTPSYGLTDEEIERMLIESIQYAETDIKQRMLIESKNEASALIKSVEDVIYKNRENISEEEVNSISMSLQALKDSIESDELLIIRSLTKELDNLTQPIAQRIMNASIQNALSAKNINEV